MERAEIRETSKPGLVSRLLRNRRKIGVAGSLTVGVLQNLSRRKVSRFSSQDYLDNKVLIRGSALETGLFDFSAFRSTTRGRRLKGVIAQVAQRRLKDKQPKEKTETDYLVKEQEKEYQTWWKIKTGNVLDSCNQRSTQQCMKSGIAKHLGVAGIHQQNGLFDETNVTLFAKVRCFLIQSGLSKVFWADDTTRSTYIVNRSPSLAIRFKKTVDMLEVFGWLAVVVVVRDLYKKFYNSQGRVPNHCSSSIVKTRGLLSFSRGIGWEGLIMV
nr:hypothetical protein [Tanacetum cinerariifolium]